MNAEGLARGFFGFEKEAQLLNIGQGKESIKDLRWYTLTAVNIHGEIWTESIQNIVHNEPS